MSRVDKLCERYVELGNLYRNCQGGVIDKARLERKFKEARRAWFDAVRVEQQKTTEEDW